MSNDYNYVLFCFCSIKIFIYKDQVPGVGSSLTPEEAHKLKSLTYAAAKFSLGGMFEPGNNNGVVRAKTFIILKGSVGAIIPAGAVAFAFAAIIVGSAIINAEVAVIAADIDISNELTGDGGVPGGNIAADCNKGVIVDVKTDPIPTLLVDAKVIIKSFLLIQEVIALDQLWHKIGTLLLGLLMISSISFLNI